MGQPYQNLLCFCPLHATNFFTMNKNKYPIPNIFLSTVLELWLAGILLVLGLL